MVQCVFEIKKKINQNKKCFKIKIGINYGEYKINIIDNQLKNCNNNNDDFINDDQQSFKYFDFITNEKKKFFYLLQ